MPKGESCAETSGNFSEHKRGHTVFGRMLASNRSGHRQLAGNFLTTSKLLRAMQDVIFFHGGTMGWALLVA